MIKKTLHLTLSKFVCSKREVVMQMLSKIFPVDEGESVDINNEQLYNLIHILLESNLRLVYSNLRLIYSTKQSPQIKLLQSFLFDEKEKKKKNDEWLHRQKNEESNNIMNFVPYKFSKQVTSSNSSIIENLRRLEKEEKSYYKFWQFVGKVLYQIIFSNDEKVLFTLHQEFFPQELNHPKNAVDSCQKILYFIITSYQLRNNNSTLQRSAIMSIVNNSLLIRYKLEILKARESFATSFFNNNNINENLADSQQATLKLLHIMENLIGLTKSSSVLWKVLSKVLPNLNHRVEEWQEEEEREENYWRIKCDLLFDDNNNNKDNILIDSNDDNGEKRKRKMEQSNTAKRKRTKKIKSEEKLIIFNSATYSVAGSIGTKCWDRGTVVDTIITSVFQEEKNDIRLLSYIYRCLALFQLSHQSNQEIGVWLPELLENYSSYIDNEGKFKINNGTPHQNKYLCENHAFKCVKRLLNKFIYYDNDDIKDFNECDQLYYFISKWLNFKFSKSEIGVATLASILSNWVSLILQEDNILDKFNNNPEYAICDDDSFALTRQFIPINNTTGEKIWKKVLQHPMDLTVLYSPSFLPTPMYIKIESREMMAKWAIAIMLRNAYYVLYHRQNQLVQYNKYILPVDFVIDSGFPCVRIDNISEIHHPLDDNINCYDIPAYHYLEIMFSIYLRMLSNFSYYDVRMDKIENFFFSITDYYGQLKLLFIPPLPTYVNNNVNIDDIFQRIKSFIKKNTYLYDENLLNVKSFINDESVIIGGYDFIMNCASVS